MLWVFNLCHCKAYKRSLVSLKNPGLGIAFPATAGAVARTRFNR